MFANQVLQKSIPEYLSSMERENDRDGILYLRALGKHVEWLHGDVNQMESEPPYISCSTRFSNSYE